MTCCSIGDSLTGWDSGVLPWQWRSASFTVPYISARTETKRIWLQISVNRETNGRPFVVIYVYQDKRNWNVILEAIPSSIACFCELFLKKFYYTSLKRRNDKDFRAWLQDQSYLFAFSRILLAIFSVLLYAFVICGMSLSVYFRCVTVRLFAVCHCPFICACHCQFICGISLSVYLRYVTFRLFAVCHCPFFAVCHCPFFCGMSLSVYLRHVTVHLFSVCHCPFICGMSLSVYLRYVTVRLFAACHCPFICGMSLSVYLRYVTVRLFRCDSTLLCSLVFSFL